MQSQCLYELFHHTCMCIHICMIYQVDGPAVIGEYPILKGVRPITTADSNRSSSNSAAATAIATEVTNALL
jgi:hypothetical protein